ncbi:YbaK/EbsC family protein [Paroceanicella profunda]|uniref:YbaK/EbsC family protein n=1 Tax=Paroceanicella profunda TaxID=2579971 RepID=A0A5B8FI66_9RHOB|nr:YbaK/EbsC family protein [Paroceanicella profunda]QDL92748.1 YbaK/EbsC family protein [Paroceanicella profunda]
MSKSVKRVRAAAEALGLDIALREMDASTRTAAEAAAACGCAVNQIVKSLIFAGGDGTLVLLLVAGGNRVDPEIASRACGTELGRADAAEVRARTGFAIGGVSPIGHLEAPRVFMDPTLLGFDTVWAAAGSPNAVFRVSPAVLAEATGAVVTPLG